VEALLSSGKVEVPQLDVQEVLHQALFNYRSLEVRLEALSCLLEALLTSGLLEVLLNSSLLEVLLSAGLVEAACSFWPLRARSLEALFSRSLVGALFSSRYLFRQVGFNSSNQWSS